ncbi:lytic murein transglycosylase [Mesorhizobium sp. WSM4313]|nr:lytic murein transglycosylase [Mesorhizobium sp. WSM4313]
MGWRDSAPLWPAGHLPHEGGDQMSLSLRQSPTLQEVVPLAELLIFPLVAEMPGRAEGGAKELDEAV